MTSRKKLIEHSLPLDAINAASSREKSVRHGHPSTLHLWWARRPLAACRAVIFAQLVDDPGSWPELFPTEEDQKRERRRLHNVIEDMVEWPKAAKKDQQRFKAAIKAARFEIARSIAREKNLGLPHEDDAGAVITFLQEQGPPVYDPFCGGGSIPLEAQRLGLRAYGSDLNPVAVLITKALIEFPPKFAGLQPVHPGVAEDANFDKDLAGHNWEGAEGLAEDVRRYGKWMRDEAEKRIGHLYPDATLKDGSKAKVIAWLWARTVASPDPAQNGSHVPLASSFILSSKKGQEAIAIPTRDINAPDGWRFEVKTKGVTSQELAKAKEGTIGRSTAGTCFLSGANMSFNYVRDQGKTKGLGIRLMAIVAEGSRSRDYFTPTREQETAAEIEKPNVPELQIQLPKNPRDFKTPNYGLKTWQDLFTPRQLTALTCFSDLVAETRERIIVDARAAKTLAARKDLRALCEGGSGTEAYADAVATYLAFCVDKASDYWSSVCSWHSSGEKVRNTFGRQAIPMVWDFTEGSPFSSSTGNWMAHVDWVWKVISAQGNAIDGHANLIDAPKNNYPIRPTVISTDPPYYDNIGYADLSDFFYVWLHRTLKPTHPELFRRLATPKDPELVATPYRYGGKDAAEQHFMSGMSNALTAMKNASVDMPLAIYYAFKQAEIAEAGILSPGWASFLQAVVGAGLQVDGTWPIRTEMATRMIASGANALASSVVLVCRKRADDAPVASRRDFQRELRLTMQAALADQQESIPLPDRRQAAIGPGIGVSASE